MPSVSPEIKAGRLSVIMLIFFGAILFNLFRMQVLLKDSYRSLSERNRLRVIYLEGPRGRVLDRRGQVMATSRLSFNCSVIPSEARKSIDASIRTISAVLGEDPETLQTRFRRKKPGAFRSVLLAEDISASQAMMLEERIDSLPGVLIETRPQREYPLGEAAAHLVGYLGPPTEEEEEEADSWGADFSPDWRGREGVERFYESYLRGRPGGLQMEVDSRGRSVKALGVREPQEGLDIQLTADAGLQKAVHEWMKDKKGAAIVMDLRDGGVLALVSEPSFDPNLFSSTRGRKRVGPYLEDPDSPMMDRAVRGQYPPGSIFKIVTALAALEGQRIGLSKTFSCPGFLMVGRAKFRCWSDRGHGPQGLTEAFAHSCDVFFYMTGLAAGPDAISKKAVEFGLSSLTGIDMPGERKGLVPSREWKQRRLHTSWFDGDTTNFAIGQGFLQVTPAQALVMAAVIATDGQLLTPHVVDSINGVKVSERYTRQVRITPEYLKAVQKGLDAVVNTDTGTGRLARAKGVRVAGKTGTAETGQEGTHAWFVGYAPEEKPRAAVVVFVEHGGHGGVAAAGVGGKIFEWLKENSYL